MGRGTKFLPADRAEPLECARIAPLFLSRSICCGRPPIAQSKAAEYARTPNASRLSPRRRVTGGRRGGTWSLGHCRKKERETEHSAAVQAAAQNGPPQLDGTSWDSTHGSSGPENRFVPTWVARERRAEKEESMQYPVSPKPLSVWTASVRRRAECSNGLEGPSA